MSSTSITSSPTRRTTDRHERGNDLRSLSPVSHREVRSAGVERIAVDDARSRKESAPWPWHRNTGRWWQSSGRRAWGFGVSTRPRPTCLERQCCRPSPTSRQDERQPARCVVGRESCRWIERRRGHQERTTRAEVRIPSRGRAVASFTVPGQYGSEP